MKCLLCGKRTYVLKTQYLPTTIRRQRRCPRCKSRTTTFETTQPGSFRTNKKGWEELGKKAIDAIRARARESLPGRDGPAKT